MLDNVMYVRDRRSLRLQGYDYAQAGAYFVTICTQGRTCLLCQVAVEEVHLSDAGKMVQTIWDEVPERYAGIETDAFVVMPNHIHGIIVIVASKHVVGAGPCACPNHDQTETVASVGAGLALPEGKGAAIPGRGESCIRPDDFHRPGSGDHKDRPYGTTGRSLGRVIQAFKSTTTHEYAIGVQQRGWPPFNGRLWQRNYYEHVIRNDHELDRIREYIATNPLKWALDRENPQRTGASDEEDAVSSGSDVSRHLDQCEKWSD